MCTIQRFTIIKKLINYELIDVEISEATVRKFKNHLWYLSPETCAIAFFDKNVPINVKKKAMVKALSRNLIDQDDEVDVPKKFNLINMSREDLLDKDLISLLIVVVHISLKDSI